MNASPAATLPRVPAAAVPGSEVRESAGGAAGRSPRLKARLAGVLWLAVIVTSMAAFFIQGPMIVSGDAAATARNVAENEGLFRLGFTVNLAAGICYLGVTVLLYALLKPAGRTVAQLAAAFGVAGVTAGAAGSLLQLVALAVLNRAPYLGAFTDAQLQALAYTFLRLDTQGFQLGMLLFGLQVILLGWLIVRSTFLPRALGVLLAIGGLSYVASSLAGLLSPALGAGISPFVIPAALIGEGTLVAWLLVKGVDAARWQERAARQ
jgi:Domain of unknown function (DUF4386)